MKTPMLESYFNKAAGLKVSNFIKKRLQHRCFPMNIAKFLATPILKNTCERLLLRIISRACDLNKYDSVQLMEIRA